MAQMVAGLPHAAGLQPGGLPPAVLQSLIEGRGYTWGPELGAPTGIRPEGYSPANGSARGNGGSGNGNGGSAGGGSAGGGSAGGGSGGTHSSGALSHGPVGGSSPSGSSEEEVEGERSNPGSKGQNFQNGRSSSGSGGTEGTSEKDKVANVSLPGHAPGHLAGAAPGSFSAFTSFARWAPAPSSVWPQHGPADSTNYRTVSAPRMTGHGSSPVSGVLRSASERLCVRLLRSPSTLTLHGLAHQWRSAAHRCRTSRRWPSRLLKWPPPLPSGCAQVSRWSLGLLPPQL